MLFQEVKDYLPLGLRVVQSLFALVALATAAGGFATQKTETLSARLGSSEFDFLLLLNFTIWLGTTLYIFLVYYLKKQRPTRMMMLGVDALLTILLFSGGVAAAVSDYVDKCDSYNGFNTALRCGSLKASVAFTFLLMAAVIASGVMTFFNKDDEYRSSQHDDLPVYSESKTPTVEPSVIISDFTA